MNGEGNHAKGRAVIEILRPTDPRRGGRVLKPIWRVANRVTLYRTGATRAPTFQRGASNCPSSTAVDTCLLVSQG
jgi:hypothetical protein